MFKLEVGAHAPHIKDLLNGVRQDEADDSGAGFLLVEQGLREVVDQILPLLLVLHVSVNVRNLLLPSGENLHVGLLGEHHLTYILLEKRLQDASQVLVLLLIEEYLLDIFEHILSAHFSD